jgi:exodeoxyribonuclease X
MTIVLFTVIDLETTGMEPPSDVIEIGVTRLYLDTDTKAVEIKGPTSRLFRNREEMTPENIAVHHLTPAMLAGYEFCEGSELAEIVQQDAPQFIVAANASFEKKWLDTPEIVGVGLDGKAAFWICTVKASARLYPDAESHSNQAMRYRLGLDLPEHLAMPPHRAGPDSFVTAHILGRFLADGVRVRDLVQWEREPRWMPRIRFGKHKGSEWIVLPDDYLQWLVAPAQAEMDPDVRHWATIELERRRNAA